MFTLVPTERVMLVEKVTVIVFTAHGYALLCPIMPCPNRPMTNDPTGK